VWLLWWSMRRQFAASTPVMAGVDAWLHGRTLPRHFLFSSPVLGRSGLCSGMRGSSIHLTFRANFRTKMRIALGSWDEQKNCRNPRTSRRHPGHPRAPEENGRGRIIGPTLPDPWPLAGIASRLDDSRVVRLPALRGRPPALSGRAMGHSPSAPPQAMPRQTSQTACPR